MLEQARQELLARRDALADRQLRQQASDPLSTGLASYLASHVRTADEHDPAAGAKLLPAWPYLSELTGEYLDHPLLLVEKCRQVLVTWWACAVVSWELRSASRWGWISLKEDAADAALERVFAIVRNLGGEGHFGSPGGRSRWWVDPGGLRWDRSSTRLQCSSGGSLVAMSQSADETRSYTFSGLIVDEAALLTGFRETLSALLPTIDGGGRAVLITTPGPFGLCERIYSGKDA